jgi:hypothetical protein
VRELSHFRINIEASPIAAPIRPTTPGSAKCKRPLCRFQLCRFHSRVTVTVHKIIVNNDPDDELSSTRNMIASMH